MDDKKVVKNKALNVNNDALEAALAAMSKDKSQENLTKLLTTVSKARLLVPVEFPKNVDKAVVQRLLKGENLSGSEMPRMLPTLVRSANGDCYAPAFTTDKHLSKDMKYHAVLNVPIDEVIRIATDEKLKLKGIILNPNTDKMILHPQFLEAVKKYQEAAKQPREFKMTKPQFEAFARKNVECALIPQAAFKEKGAFMDRLEAEKEQLVYEFYKKPFGEKLDCPYEQEEFSVMFLNINEETVVASIEVPEKNMVPKAALAIYIVWNPVAEDIHYYLIEKGESGESNVLSGITSDGRHEELMTAPTSGSELVAILDLIREEREEAEA